MHELKYKKRHSLLVIAGQQLVLTGAASIYFPFLWARGKRRIENGHFSLAKVRDFASSDDHETKEAFETNQA